MNWTLENTADLCGLVGSLALVATGWRNVSLYRFIEGLRPAGLRSTEKAEGDKAKGGAGEVEAPAGHVDVPASRADVTQQQVKGAVIGSLEADLAKLSLIDVLSLRGGAILLVVSYGLKLFFQQHPH